MGKDHVYVFESYINALRFKFEAQKQGIRADGPYGTEGHFTIDVLSNDTVIALLLSKFDGKEQS